MLVPVLVQVSVLVAVQCLVRMVAGQDLVIVLAVQSDTGSQNGSISVRASCHTCLSEL